MFQYPFWGSAFQGTQPGKNQPVICHTLTTNPPCPQKKGKSSHFELISSQRPNVVFDYHPYPFYVLVISHLIICSGMFVIFSGDPLQGHWPGVFWITLLLLLPCFVNALSVCLNSGFFPISRTQTCESSVIVVAHFLRATEPHRKSCCLPRGTSLSFSFSVAPSSVPPIIWKPKVSVAVDLPASGLAEPLQCL